MRPSQLLILSGLTLSVACQKPSEDTPDDSSCVPSTEWCDGVDNDCDGETDEDDAVDVQFWYPDSDGDGYGVADAELAACAQPEGYAGNTDDCDDSREDVHPGAEEVAYDGAANDCQGSDLTDVDGDGFDAEIVGGDDCDDTDADINPDAQEVCDDLDRDEDCDGLADDDDPEGADGMLTVYPDADNDGFGDAADSGLTTCDSGDWLEDNSDCNDADAAYNPGVTEDDCADPNDYNCDGSVGYEDGDGDGWAACEECDDLDSDINPDASEVCDGVDNDCDTLTDDEDDDTLDTTWYADADEDGFGDPAVNTDACDVPDGYVSDSSDSDDSDARTYPGAQELCDGAQNDSADAAWTDDDGLATFFGADGSAADWTSMSGGVSVSSSGELAICAGTWTVNLSIGADDVSIVGSGQGVTFLDGDTSGRVVNISDHTGLSLESLTLTGGSASSGGGLLVSSSSSATLSSVTVSDNTADSGGGLMAFDDSHVTLSNATFEDNTATDYGGGLAITEDCSVTISNSTLSGNEAYGGGGLYLYQSDATLSNSAFLSNTASYIGGGLYITENSTASGTDIDFSGSVGQDIYISNSGEGGYYNFGLSSDFYCEGITCE